LSCKRIIKPNFHVNIIDCMYYIDNIKNKLTLHFRIINFVNANILHNFVKCNTHAGNEVAK
jgi:hypothetical protein